MPDSTQHAALTSRRSSRFAIAVAACVTILGLLTTGVFAWQCKQTERLRRATERERDVAVAIERLQGRVALLAATLDAAADSAATASRASLPGLLSLELASNASARPGDSERSARLESRDGAATTLRIERPASWHGADGTAPRLVAAIDPDLLFAGWHLHAPNGTAGRAAPDDPRVVAVELDLGGLALSATRSFDLPPLEASSRATQITWLGIALTLVLAIASSGYLESTRRRANEYQLRSQSHFFARRELESRVATIQAAMQDRQEELEQARRDLLTKARDLANTNRRLERRTRESESFYHTVSHELRTPLTAIREFLSILDDQLVGEINADQRDCLQTADESCVQMQRCIDDLFDAARSETGKLELLPVPTDVRALLEHTASASAQAAQRDGIRVSVHCEALPNLIVDPGRIRQVLTNLIDNAVKFSDPGSPVRVVATHVHAGDTPQVLVRVIDEGTGIAPADLDRVFDRLHQVRTDELQTRGGLGLGLSLCRSLVERHGGRIGLDSVPGQGTTAWFTLPVPVASPGPMQRFVIDPPGSGRSPLAAPQKAPAWPVS